MVDQVRSTALFNAVEVATGVFSATALQDAVIAGWIISLAKEFEDYLTGGGEQP